MGSILQHWRVISAALVAVVLVGGAYVLARGVATPPAAQASTETELLQAIAARDSDADGLSDWEEVLYGTDPRVADTFRLGMSDSEAVSKGLVVPKAVANVLGATSTKSGVVRTDPSIPIPPEGSLTATFSKSFFTLYLKAVQASPDGNLSQADLQNVATESLSRLASSVARAPRYKSLKDLTVQGSGPEALKAFATAAEAVFQANKANVSKGELLYLKDVLDHGDATAITHMGAIAKVYRGTAAGLAALAVPQELAQDDLALMNAMARMGGVIEDFTRVESDPVAAMLALQQYTQAAQDLGNAFIQLNSTYRSAGVTLSPGEPGAAFVNLIMTVAERQKTRP